MYRPIRYSKLSLIRLKKDFYCCWFQNRKKILKVSCKCFLKLKKVGLYERFFHSNMHLFKNLNFSAIPVKAEGNLVGYINNIDIPDATFTADMIPLPDGSATRVNATLRNVPRPVGKYIVKIQLYIHGMFQ